MLESEIWVEKYRPRTLDEVVGQDAIVQRLKGYVTQKNVPHLLFSGPPGTGKTASAIALARDLFGDGWRDNFIEMNASDERGIDVVRHKIKEFARTAPMGGAPFKIIFLDEADALTPDAQAALRRTMEMYSKICRFILSCNYVSRIIEPIQSRCAVFKFRPISEDAMRAKLLEIAEKENLKITADGLNALIYVAGGDFRKAINALQGAAAFGEKIDAEAIFQITATARPEELRDVLELALAGNFIEARSTLEKLLVEYGMSGEDVVNQLFREVIASNLDERLKVVLIDKLGEIDFRLTEGSNERIQLDAYLAYLSTLAKKRRE
jgi:replication factor C small subunit